MTGRDVLLKAKGHKAALHFKVKMDNGLLRIPMRII